MGFIKFKFEEDEPEEPLFGSEPTEEDLSKVHLEKAMPKKEEFIIDWEKRLGFSRDPFVDTILKPIERFITGYKEEREILNLFIIENKIFGTISAAKGYGKSTMLCWLSKQLKRFSRKIIVINIDGRILKEGQGFLSSLIFPFLSVFERMGKKHLHMTSQEITELIMKRMGNKKLVLLLDDFNSISKQNLDVLHNLMVSIQIRVILAGLPAKITDFKRHVDSIKEFKDSLRIALKGLDFSNMKNLVMKRVEFFGGIGIEPFNEPYLKRIYNKSEKSPSEMLKSCHNEAMKLSVDPDLVRKLKEEAEKLDTMVYSSEEFEHIGMKSDEYDKIDVIKHEHKDPIIINNKHKVKYSSEFENKD